MDFDEIVDAENHEVRVYDSEEMKAAAKTLAEVFNAKRQEALKAGATKESLVQILAIGSEPYKTALHRYKHAIYDANPHLNPSNHESVRQIVDMEAATGERLNDLIEEQARTLRLEKSPRPFNQDNPSLHR